MPFDKSALAKLGGSEPHKGEFRSHLQFRDEKGINKNIYGPSRSTDDEAQKDLRQIRSAGAVGATREEGLKIMMAEARRIQMTAEYQNQIQQTMERMASQEIIDESDYEDDDRSDNSEPEWMKEYPSEEDNSPEEHSQSRRSILTPLEATALLAKFRPIISTPSDLKHLLECKADPNMPLFKTGDISPLRKVMSFASEKHVVQMRDLLLQYGANESDKDRERWALRQQADISEKIMKNNYKNIDKDYNPWSGNDIGLLRVWVKKIHACIITGSSHDSLQRHH